MIDPGNGPGTQVRKTHPRVGSSSFLVGPADEPPGILWVRGSRGFHGVSQWGLVPTAPKASSTVWVFPVKTAPCSRRRATSQASRDQSSGSARAVPAKVGTPSIP